MLQPRMDCSPEEASPCFFKLSPQTDRQVLAPILCLQQDVHLIRSLRVFISSTSLSGSLLFIHLFIFRQRVRKGERKGEKHQCVVASHAPPTGDLACTQACALTGNRTSDPLVHKLALNPLSHISQGMLFL